MIRLVRHLTWHDLRATRLLVLLWLAVVALEIAFVVWTPLASVAEARSDDSLTFVLELTRWLGAAVLTAVIVQRDPLGDPSAFWRTRPIAPTVLWLSKLTSLALVAVIVPALLMAWMLWAVGVDLASAVGYAVRLGVDHAAVVGAALLVAAPTRSLAQAITATFVTLIALVVGMAMLETIRSPQPLWTAPSTKVSIAIAVAAVLAITHMQYRTQRRGLALGLPATAVALAVIVSAFGASPHAIAEDVTLEPLPAGTVSIVLGPDAVWGRAEPGQLADDRFATSIQARNAASDTFYVPTGVSATILLSSGQVPVPAAKIETLWSEREPASLDDAPYRNLRALLGVNTMTLPPYLRQSTVPRLILPVPRATRGEMEAGRGRLAAEVVLAEHRLEAMATLAAVEGATAPTVAGRMRVVGLSSRPGELVVDLHSIGTGIAGAMSVLVSADRTRAVLVDGQVAPTSDSRPSNRRRLSMGGFLLTLTSTGERVTFPMPAGSAAMREEAWQGATLVLVQRYSTLRSRRVTLTLDGIGRLP